MVRMYMEKWWLIWILHLLVTWNGPVHGWPNVYRSSSTATRALHHKSPRPCFSSLHPLDGADRKFSAIRLLSSRSTDAASTTNTEPRSRSFQYDPKKIRNFSIIAHIGKA